MERQHTHQAVMYQVMIWLGISSEEYAQYQYEFGLRFLKATCGPDAESLQRLERSRKFWYWWQNKWVETDQRFNALPALEKYVRWWIEAAWLNMHNPELLATEMAQNPSLITISS